MTKSVHAVLERAARSESLSLRDAAYDVAIERVMATVRLRGHIDTPRRTQARLRHEQ
jgi:glutamate dehydrogenase/leucine dehydrogenase